MNFCQKYNIYKQCPLDQVLRYLPIINILEKRKQDFHSILEVGSGDFGITRFYLVKIDGLDINFNQPNLPYLNPIKASVFNMPFTNNSYDLVVSMDMMEHLSTEDRKYAVREIVRVAKKCVIIGFPCGSRTEEYEKKFNARYRKEYGQDHPWLKEHFLNRLPNDKDMKEIIKRICDEMKDGNYTIRILKNVNIILWYLSRVANLPGNYFLLPLRGRFAPLLIWLWKRFNFGECYRRIFIIEFYK